MHDRIDITYREIEFFMGKCFHFSYLYLAAIFAVVGGNGYGVLDSIAKSVGTSPMTFACIVILIINLLYLIAATSCLASVLKRGLFVLTNNDGLESMRNWEDFRRTRRKGKFKDVGWNVDNYFFVAMFVIVVVISVLSLIIGFKSALKSNPASTWLRVLLCLHIVPAMIIRELKRIERQCRDIIGAV